MLIARAASPRFRSPFTVCGVELQPPPLLLVFDVSAKSWKHPVKPDKVVQPMIRALLEKYPGITGMRVREELADSRLDGGRTIVTDYLRKLRPRPKKEPVVRFETKPGHQGQMDESPYTMNFARNGHHQFGIIRLIRLRNWSTIHY